MLPLYRFRPKPVTGKRYPHAALLVDAYSQEVYRPKGRFEEAKIYWDAKNHIYALKKQVAVSAISPHYALFSAKGYVGSTHDYIIFKETFDEFSSYLMKTTGEVQQLEADRGHTHWAVICDRAYVGSPSDTTPIRRIHPTKGDPRTLSVAIQNENKEIGEMR